MTVERHSLDTPIDRALISELPISDLEDFIERIRERRLRNYSIYLAGIEAKKEKEHTASAVMMTKRLDDFVKTHDTVVKNILKLEKIANDIQGLRIVLGDFKALEK